MASGDFILAFTALDGVPPEANSATRDKILVASTDEPDDLFDVLDFDPGATAEHIDFRDVMPVAVDFTATIVWTSESASATETCHWELAFKSFTDAVDNLGTKAYATARTVDADHNGTARVLNYDTITFTQAQADNIAAGEFFGARLSRDGNDANDDMNSDDAEFLALILTET